MSSQRFASLGAALREAAVEAAWTQWPILGGQASVRRKPSAIVDPEALVLASLWLGDHEARLGDFLTGFAGTGSRLLSVQRLKRAIPLFPDDASLRLGRFATEVVRAGKDPRWRALAGPVGHHGRLGKVAPATARLGEPAALMVRLRTGIGVDVRTDTLAYLIGRRGAWADVREISDALLYAKFSVRGACEALADARLIKLRKGRPVAYYCDPQPWSDLLEMSAVPAWHPWVLVYAFALRLEAWLAAPSRQKGSADLAASLAREFVHEHGKVFTTLQLRVPDIRDYPGALYLEAFEQSVDALVTWLRESV